MRCGDPMLVVPELRRQALALNQDAAFRSVRLRDAIGYSLYVPMLTASLLVVVGAAEPATFTGAALCLLLVTLLASYGPAKRAARIDPVIAMRSQ